MVDCGILAGKPLRTLLAALALLPAFCFPAQALQSVVLAWNPDPDRTVAGYIVSYGTNSGNYDNQTNAGANTSIEVSSLVEGQTNYFVVAAYNGLGTPGVPSPQIAYVVPGGSTASQTGSLQVTLNLAGAQWAVDNGILQNSGAIVSGLSVGSHTVTFSAANGWTMPASQTISIADSQTNSITATYVASPETGSLQVTLSPAVTQWAVDNGPLQNSGATVSGLSVGLHTVTFSALSGWTAPASQTISIADSQTNSITATYVASPQTGSLQVTLNVAGAKWAVDHGALQSSGAIVFGLSVGLHSVTFSAAAGWATPVSQVISVAVNQTTSVTATYSAIAGTGSVQVTLTPAVTQWAVDNGPLQNSGAIISGLSVGLHTITFSALSGWTTLASQTISVAANQTTSVSATYAEISETGSVQVTLSPATAQWSVDNGPLQHSGATVSGLSAGSHTITFSALSGWTTLASQTISIAANQTTSVAATYAAISETGSLQVTLNPAVTQWAVDNGPFQNSGATVSGLSVGSHTITFSALSGWTTLASQTISVAANQTTSMTATYAAISETGSLQVALSPASAQWSVDNGPLQHSGATVSGLAAGSHTITFSALNGWTTLASQTISIVANQTTSMAATYAAIPQTGSLQVTLSPAVTQWAVDNGPLQNSGATVSGLSVGSHTVAFKALSGWTTPAIEVISVAANQTTSVTATYLALPATGSVQVTLNPAMTQWAVDHGALQNSGAIVFGLSVGLHTITFSAADGWTTPASQTISVVANRTTPVTGTYVAIPPTGSLQVTLNPAVTQWAMDNGPLQNSGATITGLSVGSHTVTFGALSGWTTPASKRISVAANQTTSVTAIYLALPATGAVQVTLNPAMAQWAVDHGALQSSGAIVFGLSVGLHTVTFSAASGWTTPASQTIYVVANRTTSVTATYVAIPPSGSLQVNLSPAVTQWAVDNGPLQNSGATVSGLSVGSHTVTFSALSGWTTPASKRISVAANQTTSVTAIYAALPPTGSLQVTLNPAVAQWAVDHGALQNSGAIVFGLSVGSHTVTFSAASGWITPASQTISVVANRTTSVTATYVAIPPTGSLQVTLSPAVTQWAVDHGALQNSGATVSGLSVGSHTVTFSTLGGWTTPNNQTISIVANQTNSIAANYVVIPRAGSPPTTHPVTSGTISRTAPEKQTIFITENQKNTQRTTENRTQVIRNLSAAMGGTYNGLFYPADAVTEATSGMLNGLIVKTNGRYSGKILISGSSVAVSGTFDVTGHASQVIARTPRLGGALTLDMTLTWNGALLGIVGTVSGTNGGPWVANLFADPAAASAQSYQYTLLFPPAATASAGSPPGFGYATITNHDGTATIAGALADATSFSQHVPISADGSLPFYVAFGTNELLLGWITNLYSQTPGGEIAWIKGGSLKSVNFNQGFTNLIAVMGSVWTNAAPEHAAIDLSNAPLTFFESGLTEPLNYLVTVAANNIVEETGNAPTGSLTGIINPKTGLLQLTFGNGDGKAAERAYGAILQNSQIAGGYFMTQTNGGAFELRPVLLQ
jgi:hypothetical protein